MKIYNKTALVGPLLDHLKQLPFLQKLGDQYFENFIKNSYMVAYDANEPIIREGDIGKTIYILLQGQVRLTKQGQTIGTLFGTGEIFGEMAMFHGGVRTASLTAIDKVVCLAIELSDVTLLSEHSTHEQIAGYTILYGLMAQMMAERLALTTGRLVEVMHSLKAAKTHYHLLKQVEELVPWECANDGSLPS